MKLLDLIQPAAIVPELAATERNAAIRELVQALADAKLLRTEQAEPVARSIITRERTRGTTGFGKGVAVPHAKVEDQAQIVAAVGRSTAGIDFSSLDGQPVHIVFLIVSPQDRPEEHLRAMDLIFRHLQQEKFRKFLRQLDDRDKIYDLLKEADEKALVA
ncbi:MAG: PTS sugar transporter subunit IIA [Phycisphaerales bacterium]|nr:PTS sugar transporter subunit IIA [Phycisphaerales bacterium]